MPRHENPVVASVFDLVEKSIVLNEHLVARFSIDTESPPIVGFNILNGHAIRSYELLGFYHMVSQGHPSIKAKMREGDTQTPAERHEELMRRVMQTLTTQFTQTMSGFEFSMRQCVQIEGCILDCRPRKYLRDYVIEGFEKGVVTEADKDYWLRLVDVRNAIVHNNGIMEKDYEALVEGGPVIRSVAGRELFGALTFFIEIISWMNDAFYRFCDKIYTESSAGYLINIRAIQR